MSREKCPVCGGSNFYDTGSNFNGSLMGLDDKMIQAFGNEVRYSICKDCKNIQFWLKQK